jgi:tRNA threonylcarbamoyladenosine biosynthesis protein TsaE
MNCKCQFSKVSADETSFTFESHSAGQTEELGAKLGKLLEQGDVVTLAGELGGGKTCFVRGLVSSVSPSSLDMVASPTFALLNEYPGQPPVMHYDCYRLRGTDDAIELGLNEHLEGQNICLIEWPDRINEILPYNRIDIEFEYAGETERRITFCPIGEKAVDQLKKLLSKIC